MSEEKEFRYKFDADLVDRTQKAISSVYPKFQKEKFLSLKKKLSPLSMKERVRLISTSLKASFPDNYLESLEYLVMAVKKAKLEGIILWPITDFVYLYGLKNKKESLDALKFFTTLFTSEWAVRSYLLASSEFTLKYLLKESQNSNVHVRRWASEGSRPRLPWGERLDFLIEKPELTIPILKNLIFDDELYVRKSVANHLNDISKDHPDFLMKILKEFKLLAQTKSEREKIDWIIKHALRTLIKKGNKKAFSLIGVSHEAKITAQKLKILRNKITYGDYLEFSFSIKSNSNKEQKIVVDYEIDFVKANNRRGKKVFKLKTFNLLPYETKLITKKHLFKIITTRTYYAGKHLLTIKINGKDCLSKDWLLDV